MTETVEELIRSRAVWFAIHPVQTDDDAWQVVLTIDGNYFSRELAHEMADYWAERLMEAFVQEAASGGS